MILSPSHRLLIHLLAVLCISLRVVLSEEPDLLAAVVASNDADAKTNTESTDSTTDFSTTESTLSTSISPGNLSCVFSKKDVCVLEGTEDLCDPCEGVVCDREDLVCQADNSTCTFECLCADETMKLDEKGLCVDRVCKVIANEVCSLEGTEFACDPCVGRTPACRADMSCLAHNATCATECICADEKKIDKNGACIDRLCQLKNQQCILEGTTNVCDPCDGVVCADDKKCLADKTTCNSQCVCKDELKTPNKDGVCANPCDATPCQNNQPCKNVATVPSKFICDCSPDYDGETCENIHNYCMDDQPPECPLGAFECVFKGVGDYECKCAGGHTLDNATNTCTKVTQRLTVDLIFTKTYYSEEFNVEGSEKRNMAIESIQTAMKELYGTLLISISYDDFTQGSLVAHYKMDMRMPPNGDPTQNVYDLMKYTTNCEAGNKNPTNKCFGDLGIPHLPLNGTTAEDLRCEDVFCPQYTQCVPVDKSEKSVRCSCMDGFKLVKTVVEDTGRQVDVCEDIDECTVNKPCKTEQMCINSPGTFECVGSPCEKNPCPGNAVCVAVDHYAYNCECEWIYIASDCGTPWPLILVIVSSVLLALLILAIIGLIILISRSKKGSSVIATTSF